MFLFWDAGSWLFFNQFIKNQTDILKRTRFAKLFTVFCFNIKKELPMSQKAGENRCFVYFKV